MKKISVLLLTLALSLAFTSCGSEEVSEPSTESSEASSSENTSVSQVIEGETLSNVMFDIILTPEWTEDTESRYEGDDYSEITLNVMEDDKAKISADVSIYTNDVKDFRSTLQNMGIDLYEYAVNGAGEREMLAGYQCVVAEREFWGESLLTYVGRDESSGTTLTVDVSGEYNDALVAQLLSTIVPKIENQGFIDYPYFWEGERITLPAASQQVGNFTVSAENISFEEAIEVDDIFSVRIAQTTSTNSWVAYDDMLFEYTLAEMFTSPIKFDLENSFSEIDVDVNGNLLISEFGYDLVKIKPDKTTVTYPDITDYIAFHPSGSWGLTYFLDSPADRINIDGDTATVEENYIPEGELFDISDIRFTQNHIVLIGNEINGENNKLMILDHGLNEMFILGGDDFIDDDDYLAAITDVVETANGFIAADGNLRNFLFWDKAGNFIGNIDANELLGTSYPWVSDMQVEANGSILISFSEEREDSSGYEVLVTRLTGF